VRVAARANDVIAGEFEIGERGIRKARAKLRRKMFVELGEPLCLARKVGVSARGAREENFSSCNLRLTPLKTLLLAEIGDFGGLHPLSAVER